MLLAIERPAFLGPEVDFWSLGIIMYEMLIGETAFPIDSALMTNAYVMNHKVPFLSYGWEPSHNIVCF